MKYLFFASWLRAREKKIADWTDLNRMAGAATLEQAFKVLNDTDYAPFLSGKNYCEIEEVMETERDDLRKSFEQAGLEKGALNFLFLKEDLIILAREIKEKLFKNSEKDGSFVKKYPYIFRKIEKEPFLSPEKVDDMLVEFYFKKAIRFCLREKEAEVCRIFKKYWREIKKAEEDGLEKRDSCLIEMEKKIIEKSREAISGIMPILAFLIKKRRAEYFIKTVLSGKRIGLDQIKIEGLIEQTKTL